MYAYIVVAGILGVLLAGAFTVAERYALHWHESQRSAKAEGQNRGYPERKGLTLVVQLSPGGQLRPGAPPVAALSVCAWPAGR